MSFCKSFRRILSCSIAIGLVLLSFPVFAARSREEELAKAQAEKAKHLSAYVPTKGERIALKVQKLSFFSGAPVGFYPFLGSAFSSGGFAGGPGYRMVFKDTGSWDVHGAWSIKNYRLLDTTLRLPDIGNGLFQTRIHGRYVDAGKVVFFGVGNDSSESGESNFSYSPRTITLTETIIPARWLHVGGGIEYLTIDTGEGEASSSPSIEQLYSPSTAPGLGTDPSYIVSNVFGEVDWRQSPGYTTRGGLYRADVFDFNQREDGNLSFRQLDLEVQQFIPVLRANQVIALRAQASFTDVDQTDKVPFFLLPKLGGSSELRGFRNFRFRDTHRLLLTAEYRWTPSKFFDMALFYEAGKVASRSGDLDLNDLHRSYGIGARFHTPSATVLRIELAHSNEATRIIFAAGDAF